MNKLTLFAGLAFTLIIPFADDADTVNILFVISNLWYMLTCYLTVIENK